MMAMMSTRKHLSRRTVLRGLGATIALPLFDGMVPAHAATRFSAADPVRRLAVVYVPNGMNMWQWTPNATGNAFEPSPILQPLAPFRDQLLVLSGLANRQANARPGESGGDHGRGQTAFLTGTHAKTTRGADVRAGVSMDQIAARESGERTQLASLELSLDANYLIGTCETSIACAYSGTICWADATTPLPMESDPRAVFERLFGASDSTDAETRLRRMHTQRSILDSVREDLGGLRKKLGFGDRTRLDEYAESVRSVERRIQIAEEQSDREVPVVARPGGVPQRFDDYSAIMFDLLALAFQSDLTRVATYLYGRELSNRSYTEVGVAEPHHPLSHHQDRPEYLEKLTRVNVFHTTLFAHFLERLGSTPDGDGSLLDHSLILYGGGLGNSDLHLHHDLPILLAGGANQFRGGRHLQFAEETPLANLHLALLDKMGVAVETLGDSTGRTDVLSL